MSTRQSKNPQIKLAPKTDWLPQNNRPLVIAGPCSAESEEQLLQTAMEVSKIPDVTIFRAGIWKPRTRPNDFEGIGVKGLQWLKKVKEKTNLKVAIEVANQRHVFEALKYNVDIFWIGARTTVNPFSVQEIADALQGADVPVWVKNPVNPDLHLWIGALERLNKAGITRLGAIHRGFSTHENTPYRNAPKWDIAIELKRLVPELPILCDPSHIAGKREYLPTLSQKAFDLAMNGLMIETHIEPDTALSDASQQIKPEALKDLLGNLQFRKSNGNDVPVDDLLETLRSESNSIDYELIEVISRRMEVVKKIGLYKKDHNMTIFQVKRWKHLIDDRLEKASKFGLDKKFVKNVYQLLHNYSIRVQSDVMNKKANF